MGEVDTRRQIRSVKRYLVGACLAEAVDQRGNQAALHIIDGQSNQGGIGQVERDGGGRIEGIGVGA